MWALIVVRCRCLIVVPQAVARGGARCAWQGSVHLSWCPSRCSRRRSLCVECNSSLRPDVTRGAAQVLERGAQAVACGGARCASRVLDRASEADARCATRCFSQVLDRGALAGARGAATLSQHEKNNSADVQWKSICLFVCSAKLSWCA